MTWSTPDRNAIVNAPGIPDDQGRPTLGAYVIVIVADEEFLEWLDHDDPEDLKKLDWLRQAFRIPGQEEGEQT